MDRVERVLAELAKRPGQTAIELARSIVGPDALQPDINWACTKLMKQGAIERRGNGGNGGPYIYFLSRYL